MECKLQVVLSVFLSLDVMYFIVSLIHGIIKKDLKANLEIFGVINVALLAILVFGYGIVMLTHFFMWLYGC